jgi:hypothetical protein
MPLFLDDVKRDCRKSSNSGFFQSLNLEKLATYKHQNHTFRDLHLFSVRCFDGNTQGFGRN